MTNRRHTEAATAAVYFGLGMPPLDGKTARSTGFMRDTFTWGLFGIRGAHVKTPQAITCRRYATTNPAACPNRRITSYLDANGEANHRTAACSAASRSGWV